jgi:hypothetical protein
MKTYLIHLFGKGEGCDYTIGCNHAVHLFEDKNPNYYEHANLIHELCRIAEEFEDRLDRWEIYEITEAISITLDKIRQTYLEIKPLSDKERRRLELQRQLKELEESE